MDDLAYKLATAKLADDPDQSDPKDAAQPVDGTRRLPYIPLEILQQIAGHLDRPSAFALTLTCKGLRDAGETRLWEELDITSGWNEPVDERGFPVADPSGETWLSLHRTTDARCTAALAGLEAYEYRVECVRRLRLEPSDGVDNATAINMMALLHLVAPNLTHLDLLPLPWGDGDDVPHEPTTWPQSEVTSVEFWGYIADQVPCKYKLSCPRLETLRIAIPTSSDDQLPYVLKRLIPDSNRLSELRIESSSSQWENTWEEPTGKAYRATWKAMHPRLSSVKSLTFGDLEDGTSADLHLLEILSRAPEIGFLRILVAWGDSGDQARCWKAIAGLKKLKKLCLFSADGLDEDFIGRQELGIEELVMDDADLEEQDELSWTAQKLPRAPKLERLMIVTSRRPELHEYADQGVTTPAKPIACERISSRFARNLREYPNLTAVQLHYDEGVFPSMYQPGLDLEYLVPPHRWEKEGHRGMMIRSFDNPSNPSLVLYHIRALTRSLERVGETYVGMKRQWRDLSLYRGRTVPNHILDQVYAAAGQERRWMEGKRGVSLDSKAWSILEEWRMGVDDDSDVESSEEETDGDDGQDSDWEDEDDDMDDDTSSIGSDGAQVEVLEGEEDGAGDDGAWETDSDDPLAM